MPTINGHQFDQAPCDGPCCNRDQAPPADGQGTTRRTLDQIDARQARVEYLDRQIARMMPAQETPSDRLPPRVEDIAEVQVHAGGGGGWGHGRVNELVQQTPEQSHETAEAAKALGEVLAANPPILRAVEGTTATFSMLDEAEVFACDVADPAAPTMDDLNTFAEEHAPQETDETRQQIADHYGIDVERVQPDLVQHNGQCLPGYRIIGGRPDPAESFHQELIRKRPFLGPALDEVARDLQKKSPTSDDRPWWRRIRNARKASS